MADKSNKNTIKLTKQGYHDLKQELNELVEKKLPEVIERISQAREKGDLSENTEYQNAREDKEIIDARIAEIENVLEKAEVVNKTRSKTEIGVGSEVTIHPKDKPNNKMSFTIVGQFEGDAEQGRISSESPLGEALIGHKVGQKVTVEAPAGEISYQIDSVK